MFCFPNDEKHSISYFDKSTNIYKSTTKNFQFLDNLEIKNSLNKFLKRAKEKVKTLSISTLKTL